LMNCLLLTSLESGHRRLPDPPDNKIIFKACFTFRNLFYFFYWFKSISYSITQSSCHFNRIKKRVRIRRYFLNVFITVLGRVFHFRFKGEKIYSHLKQTGVLRATSDPEYLEALFEEYKNYVK